jgi:hypothetical protein
MSTAQPDTGTRSRKLWAVVATLTAIGLVGPVIVFLVGTAIISPSQAHTCGSAGAAVFILSLIGIALFVLAAVAALGLWIFWYRSLWGPLILVICNLLMMGLYGWAPVISPGQLLFAVVVLLFAAAPAIAGALVLWPLLTRGRLWVRAIEIVIVAAIALPVLWLYGSGVANDVRTAVTPPPPTPAYLSTTPQRPTPGCAAVPGPL